MKIFKSVSQANVFVPIRVTHPIRGQLIHNESLTLQALNKHDQTKSRFYILFQNLQNKFQVQESRVSLDTMQSIIYRRIKYILYIADKPWWVLHMYIMYVNLYLQSFLHIQKAVSIFLCIYLYLYIYIEIFHILPTSICTTIMKKKNIYIYVNPFSFYITNVFS